MVMLLQLITECTMQLNTSPQNMGSKVQEYYGISPNDITTGLYQNYFCYMWADLRKRTTSCKTRFFLSLFNLPPFQATESPDFPTWFVSISTLLLHKSNVRSYTKPSVSNGELPTWGLKRRFSNVIDALTQPIPKVGRARNSLRV